MNYCGRGNEHEEFMPSYLQTEDSTCTTLTAEFISKLASMAMNNVSSPDASRSEKESDSFS